MKYIIVLSFIACVVSLMAGCGGSQELPVGKDVIVQFDRAALGTGAALPVSPTTSSINGAETAIYGKLLHVSSDWIQLEVRRPASSGTLISTYWIPRDKVLLIQAQVIMAQ